MDWREVHAAVAADHQGLANLLRDLFKMVGVGVVRVIDRPFSAEGARILKNVDFVILPLNASGLSTLSDLRRSADSPNPFVPTLLIGVDVAVADVRSAIQFGAHDVVVLPASSHKIRERLARAVLAGRPWVTTTNYVGPCRRRKLTSEWRTHERRRSAEEELAGRIAAEKRIAAILAA
jgi:DNA-binding NarL/FixJ family response regulator